jgi:enolase-phosphatase E1
MPGRARHDGVTVIRAILTDIEGTTSSLSFVKDVLFPYARERLPGFVREHGQEAKVRDLLLQVSEVAGKNLNDEQAVEQLRQWIDEDRKVTPLKALQGMIWEAGYRNGDYRGHMYDDAVEYLQKWHDQGLRLYVYSSGSEYAQKLLFGHSDAGDLTPLFSGYFDTQVGAKQETGSYRIIAERIDLPADEILFLSDIEVELDAAAEAGMATCWLVREGVLTERAIHHQVRSFEQITV